jgi:chromosome segregation protein
VCSSDLAKRSDTDIQIERNRLNQLLQEKVGFTTRRENFQSFVAEVNEKRNVLTSKNAKLQEQIKKIEEELGEKMDLVRSIKDQISNMDGSFRDVAEQLSGASTQFNERNIDFIRQQNKVGALQRELVFRENQLKETRSTLTSSQVSVTEGSEEIKSVIERIDRLQGELQEAYKERKNKESSLSEAEQLYFQARGGINELEDNIRKSARVRQDAQVLINQLKEKESSVKFDVSSVAQRLRIEFSIDVNQIVNEELGPVTDSLDELQMKVDRYKSRLDNYGEINPMAVEAYDEMKERHETISQQRNDIVEAKDSLIETIKEIEETATSQFLDSFNKARLYFIDVFRSLFTSDDNCDLILLEPENPLESKIEIVAKPKGKRPQTISQLSGGEKTLTATALLFALYLLKPAPFCIFDEVDAPLDDANINKFNKIIKKFSKDSQFIIVTHNKLTMASVDTIYGVYMAEQGVSGVSRVDFRDFDHKATFEVAQN